MNSQGAAREFPQAEFISAEDSKNGDPGRRAAPIGACGITFEKFQDIKVGDIIEAFLMEQIEV